MTTPLISLGITVFNYNYLMGFTGILCGFLFCIVVIGYLLKL